MKTKLFFLFLAISIFTIRIDAQIKLHNGGGISIGSLVDPGVSQVSIVPTLTLSNGLSVTGATTLTNEFKIHSGGGISIGSTTDPGDDKIKLHNPTTFGSTVTFDGSFTSNIIPTTGNPYNLGASSNRWQNLYAVQLDATYLYLGTSGKVKSNLVPFANNTYSLGIPADQGGSHRWKDVYCYNMFTETLEINGFDLIGYVGGYGPQDFTIQFGSMGNISFNTGPTSYLGINTSRSYYRFDEELWVPSSTYVYSDINLKENITKIKDKGSSLDKIAKLEGIIYNLKADEEKLMQTGFSAQEVQKVMPELVLEDDEGTLAVCYTGVIPYLVEALKEQKIIIESMQIQINSFTSDNLEKSSIISGPTINQTDITSELFQNAPNPFSDETTIKYFLGENVKDASIFIYDMTGKQLKAYKLHHIGGGEINIYGGEFNAGIYTYCLIADGILYSSKQMILTD